jgi:hypothetical protein
LVVRELQTHIFSRAASAAVQRPQLRRRDAAVFSTPVDCYNELKFRFFLHFGSQTLQGYDRQQAPRFYRSPFFMESSGERPALLIVLYFFFSSIGLQLFPDRRISGRF